MKWFVINKNGRYKELESLEKAKKWSYWWGDENCVIVCDPAEFLEKCIEGSSSGKKRHPPLATLGKTDKNLATNCPLKKAGKEPRKNSPTPTILFSLSYIIPPVSKDFIRFRSHGCRLR